MLQEIDFQKAAGIIGCSVAAIKAVTHTEAGGRGFFDDGHVIIKFEGHVFHHFTGGKYDASHPTLSYPAWTEKYSPEKSHDQYIRFSQAFALDPKAAMLATSWGMFQIMGENYSSCHFLTVGDFVDAMKRSELAQLEAFCAYVKIQGLAKYLVNMSLPGQALVQAAGFALRYNGSGFKKNEYDTKIASNYAKYAA